MDDDRHIDDESEATRSGRVRIIGAEPVGQLPGAGAPGTGETTYPAGTGPPPEAEDPEAPPGAAPPEPQLPHWTAAPTGEVPAVLARPGSEPDQEDQWSALPEPTWREERSDWAAHEETFEPSMLAEDQGAPRGSLSDSELGDRQPWEFELPLSGEVRTVAPLGRDHSDEDTMVVPTVPPVGHGPLFGGPDPAAEPVARHAFEPAAAETGSAPAESPEPAGLGDQGGPAADLPGVPAGDFEAFGPLEEPAPPLRRGLGRRPRLGVSPPEKPGGSAADAETIPGLPGGTEPEAPPTSEPGARRRLGSGAPTAPTGGAPSGRTEDRPVTREPARPARRPAARRPEPGRGPLDEASGMRETRSDRNLPVAIATGVVIGVIALVFFDLGTITAMIVSTVVLTLAAVEAYAGFRKAGYHPATLLGIVGVFSVMVATYNKGQAAVPLLLVLVVAFTLIWHLIGVDRAAEPVRSTAATVLVFCWVGVFGSFAALLLNPNLFPHRHGIAYLLGAVITAVVYDVAALATGAWIGSHPLSKVSPNKTWEGLIGGAVAAILAAVIIVHFIHPWTVGKAAALGLVVAVVSPLGDLCESMIKRNLGLKDMGRILPGHGGFLDRIDGLLFVLPATYYLVRAFHLG